ncbi:MAG: HlyC/CorC family transporter [Deltaproteobacteria bacterium]|nr:HlyC/CorC family transporter [Deltaproteobacteria bacterium]
MARLTSLFRRRLDRVKGGQIPQELHDLIERGEERGLISEDEGDMIESILEFRDTVAKEIMIPRTDMVCIDQDSPIDQIIDLIVGKGHSRIPVYEKTPDAIVGILFAKDLFQFWGQPKDSFNLKNILRPPYYIPETKPIKDLLKEFRSKKLHMAIIIDEYGGTSGLITIEDVLEEIVGDIQDEHDHEEDWLVKVDDQTILVDARLGLDELEDFYDLKLPDGDYESVGGFIISITGSVPQVNDTVVFEDLEMTIEEADERKIDRVRIVRRTESPSQTNGVVNKARVS